MSTSLIYPLGIVTVSGKRRCLMVHSITVFSIDSFVILFALKNLESMSIRLIKGDTRLRSYFVVNWLKKDIECDKPCFINFSVSVFESVTVSVNVEINKRRFKDKLNG